VIDVVSLWGRRAGKSKPGFAVIAKKNFSSKIIKKSLCFFDITFLEF